MHAEQRFLGEILVRRGVVPADRLEALYARAAREAASTSSTSSSTRTSPTR